MMELSEMELREQLETMRRGGVDEIKNEDIPALLPAMLHYIGAPDPVLRDELIYSMFSVLVTQERLDADQRRALFAAALDERHLFYRIGEQDTDSVFTRTFSMLLLALLVYAHRRRAYLSADEVRSVLEQVVSYTRQEQDFRGYVAEKSWAHAAAHCSDTLDELARCEEIEEKGLEEILAGIQALILRARLPYGYEEDERLSVAAAAVLERGLLSAEAWQAWLESLAGAVGDAGDLVERITLTVNVRGLLRSVYFRVRRPEIVERIGQARSDWLAGRCENLLAQIARF